MLVDNSIVAIENIYRLRNEEHLPILTACVRGRKSDLRRAARLDADDRSACSCRCVFVTGMAHDLFSDIGLIDHVFAAGEPGWWR